MSTRSTTHFTHGDRTVAIVYRHSDGYPEHAGTDILTFLDQVGRLDDTRFDDPSFLAARYVVFLAAKFNNSWDSTAGAFVRNESPLDFISVGVCQVDPSDIEYRYTVDCGSQPFDGWGRRIGRPTVVCRDMRGGVHAIPEPTPEVVP